MVKIKDLGLEKESRWYTKEEISAFNNDMFVSGLSLLAVSVQYDIEMKRKEDKEGNGWCAFRLDVFEKVYGPGLLVPRFYEPF